MKEYVPTPQDITELNLAAEKITDEALKSKPLCKIAKFTNFYKTLNQQIFNLLAEIYKIDLNAYHKSNKCFYV
jgi:hypothetical protein